MTQGEVTVPPSTAWHLEQLWISHALLTSLSLHSPTELFVHPGCVCKHPAWPVSWTCQKHTCKMGMKHRSIVLSVFLNQRNKQILLLRSGWYIWRCPPPSPNFLTSSCNTQQYPRASKQPQQVRQGSWCPISSIGHLPEKTPRLEDTHHSTSEHWGGQAISHLGSWASDVLFYLTNFERFLFQAVPQFPHHQNFLKKLPLMLQKSFNNYTSAC